MKIKEDLTGKNFAQLTVVCRDLTKIGQERGSFWICECTCGRRTSISRHSLVNHGTKSCGCLQKESARSHALPNAKADKNYWFSRYKRRASVLKIEFSITEKQFHDICSLNCFYCGDEPIVRSHGYKRQNDTGVYLANGIDRIDSKGGYTIENSVPCCTTCNLMKTDKSMVNFIQKTIKIAKLHGVK